MFDLPPIATVAPDSNPSNLSTWVILIVAVLLAVYALMRLALWFIDRGRTAADPPAHPPPLDIRTDLPDDPAEALKALDHQAHTPRKD